MFLSLEHYDIQFGDIFSRLSSMLAERQFSKIAVLVDENTRALCWPLLQAHLPAETALIEISSGEQHKNIASCQYIWRRMLELEIDRNGLLINLGGGVIGDMGGFCAGTYKRGISFLQIPTTLLSQVDASVGGKLGIDYLDFKNVVGLFKDPVAVLVEPKFLQTLPERQVKSGFAEIAKHALIADGNQWKELSAHSTLDQMEWSSWIPKSVAIKQAIVEIDPFEQNERKKLNFGHTIGHALESYCLRSANPLLHGEAVAWGMMGEALLSKAIGLSDEEADQILHWLQEIYQLPALAKGQLKELVPLMYNDKKNEGGQINFTMLKACGSALINQTASEAEILAALQGVNSFLQTD